MVRSLEHLLFGTFFPLTYDAADCGRVGAKLEDQSRTLEALARAAASICSSFAGYLPPSHSDLHGNPESETDCVSSCGVLPGKPPIAAKSIVAARVKLPAKLAFHLQPFMDKATRVFYDRPLDVARASEVGVDKLPFVKILARPVERMPLLKALSDSGRLAPLLAVPLSRVDWGAGLFCVAKDAQRDRLVLDARPANLLESFPGRWVHSLASATALAGIILESQ